MPFTREQFFNVFAAYNSAVWPLQVVAYLAGLAALFLVFRRSRAATFWVLMILASMWLVNGVAYHWSFFATVNPGARIFGAAFVFEATLLAATAMFARNFRIAVARDLRTWVGLLLAAYALVLYPALGWVVGHTYPAVPVFGIAPCPTTIFTIGVLFLGNWRIARWLLVIPALWASVGGRAAVFLGVPQD